MRLASMLTRLLCLTSLATICVASIAQSSGLITGYVTNSYEEGSRYVVELSQPNSCGSSKYVSKAGAKSIAIVREAVAGAIEIDGTISIKPGTCVNGATEILGIAYGPSF